MKKTLSFEEEQQILQKIRTEYKDKSKIYGERVFDLSAFEDRYKFAIEKKINMEGFLLAEISVLEKLKNKIEDKLNSKKNSFLNRVDQMMEENSKKIAHYPEYDFHDKASVELKKLLGALNQFITQQFVHIYFILQNENKTILSQLQKLIERSDYLIGETGRGYAPRIEDHILLLNKKIPDYSKIELDEKRFIKDVALFLNDLKQWLFYLIDEYNFIIEITEEEITTEQMKDLVGKTKEEVIKQSIKRIIAILTDFRITDFKSS